MEAYGNRHEVRVMQAWELIREIHDRIPGEKIISIISGAHELREFDMGASGRIGYDDMQKLMCLHTITGAIKNDGTLFIKQFLPLYSVSGGSSEIRRFEIFFRNGTCSHIQVASESSIMEKELMRDKSHDFIKYAKKRNIEREDAGSSSL